MAPIDHVVTSGTFNLDGGSFDVDNNVWIVGDDSEVFVIDAAHDADAIAAAVGDRRVKAIVCTHAHDVALREMHNLRAGAGFQTPEFVVDPGAANPSARQTGPPT